MSATITATGDITMNNYVLAAGKPNAKEFFEMRKSTALYVASVGALKFHLNKALHFVSKRNISEELPFVAQAHRVKYFVGMDEDGVLRGGNPHWDYLQNVCDPQDSHEIKFKKLCRALAELPSNVAFEFNAAPDLRDSEIVRAAFTKVGFSNIYNKTYLYFGKVADGDPIKKIKSDARTKVNSARRDMELTTMGVEEFFAFYKQNLQADKKTSHWYLDIDEAIISQNMKNIEILATRRKGLMEDGNPFPIECAICCGYGEDGYYKFMRITYATENSGVISHTPHKHALKYLIVEAMRRSAELGMVLDVDGASVGGGTVYSRFGVFEEVMRDRYKRKTAQTFTVKYCTPIAFGRFKKELKWALGRVLAFTIPAVLFYA